LKDLSEEELEDEWGPANAITPSEIINLLKLANSKSSDIFYDLGCGHGRVVRMAITYGKVKKAIGIEHEEERLV